MNVLIPSGVFPVNLDSLISGEDQTNNWLQVANGANQYLNLRPLTLYSTTDVDTTTFGAANSSYGKIIGSVGAAGDYIERIVVSIKNSNSSRFYLQDISAPQITSTGAATWASGTPTSFTFASSSASAANAATFIGKFLVATFTINTKSVTLARKIIDVPTVTSSTSYVLTIESPVVYTQSNTLVTPTAVVTTSGTHFIVDLIDIIPSGSTGIQHIDLGMKSIYGGWRYFIDSSISVLAIGKFS